MGHDITAYPHRKWKQWAIENSDDGATHIAYLRRSAFDPLNAAIYIALGVMDETYNGCSGSQCTLGFSRKQVEHALEVLAAKSITDIDRAPNAADLAAKALAESGLQVRVGGACNGDVSPEIDFLKRCVKYMDDTGEADVGISFF